MPKFDSQQDFTAEPLTSAAPQISTPWLGQVHTLHAEPLTTKPPELGENLHRILVCTALKPHPPGGPVRGTAPEYA